MKRKKPGTRRRSQQARDDEALLRRYARFEYDAARARVARKAGVSVERIKNKHGHHRAVGKGLAALRQWFTLLPEPGKAMARDKMLTAMEIGECTIPEDVDKEIMERSTPKVNELIKRAKATRQVATK